MTPLELVSYILEFLSLLFLIPTNIFILMVNLLTWIKENKFSQVEQLIISISVCNIVEKMMEFIWFLNIIYNIPVMTKNYFALGFLAMSCNVWFSTFLCVYFCLKIVNVKNTLYICLQRNFQKILPWLFVSAILGSVLVSVPFILKITEENSLNSGFNISLNMQTLAIVTSLIKHMNHVQENIGGFRSPNMKVHVQALRTVILFLITNIIIFIVLTVNLTSPGNIWSYVIIHFYNLSKMTGCWSIIKGNRNLDKTLRNIFSKLHCTNTSNDIE
ncbi:hypothetical protein GDO81_023125 [Engystomops pustulosus]|uniref:Taste receptor type 2 n=1 Tax=Engystomops pustulosus TaxID=76066 RepID=A0AAV6ZIW6_ENGPU|nr:hypothetical protein GDO81_023125 [Engystomops pustulosus]